jgi:hypothetical protein
LSAFFLEIWQLENKKDFFLYHLKKEQKMLKIHYPKKNTTIEWNYVPSNTSLFTKIESFPTSKQAMAFDGTAKQCNVFP